MLMLDSFPEVTREVFDHLAANEQLRGFTLIGGMALATQFGHRCVEDLDFWLPAECLGDQVATTIVRTAQKAGFRVFYAKSRHPFAAADNPVVDLSPYSRDFVIGGVKVSLLACNDPAYQYFDRFARVTIPGASFSVMGEDGLFAMKSYVIHRRTRSRDLFDLKGFMMRGRSVDDLFAAMTAVDQSLSIDQAKAVLVGDVPLDKDDEGIEGMTLSGVQESIADIYAFFRQALGA